MHQRIIDIIGWIGATLVIVAYALSSFAVIAPTSIVYQLLNIFGSLGIIFSSWQKKNYQPVLLNVVWVVIAIIIVIKILL